MDQNIIQKAKNAVLKTFQAIKPSFQDQTGWFRGGQFTPTQQLGDIKQNISNWQASNRQALQKPINPVFQPISNFVNTANKALDYRLIDPIKNIPNYLSTIKQEAPKMVSRNPITGMPEFNVLNMITNPVQRKATLKTGMAGLQTLGAISPDITDIGFAGYDVLKAKLAGKSPSKALMGEEYTGLGDVNKNIPDMLKTGLNMAEFPLMIAAGGLSAKKLSDYSNVIKNETAINRAVHFIDNFDKMDSKSSIRNFNELLDTAEKVIPDVIKNKEVKNLMTSNPQLWNKWIRDALVTRLDDAKTKNIGISLQAKPVGGMEAVKQAEIAKGLTPEVTTTKIQPELPQKAVQPQQKIVQPSLEKVPLTDNIPQVDPVVKITEALKNAKPIRAEQQKLYSIERGKRIAKVAGVGAKVPGEQGYFAQLGQLKGELPKVQFESIRKQFTQPDIDALFNKVESTPMSPFEKVTAKTGLSKLLGGQGGTVPTRGELKLLAEVFPPEFIDAALKNRSTLEKVFSMGEEVLNLPRAFMSTLDLSAPMRQGVFLIGRPKQWVPAFKDMFKFAASENAYKGLQENIRSRPTYQAMRDSGLAITDLSPNLLSREESFMSTLPEKIPGFGALNKASNRAYSGFLNKLRADTFDDLLSKAKSLGVLNENPEVTKDIAKFVNSATGRGDLGALNKASVVLNGAFFSPRLMASRLNLLNPVYYTKLDPFVRKEALKSLLGFGAVAGSIVGLSNLAGADVVTDPRSADFGKIKVGDTRYDPWGGFQQYMVLGSRLATGEMVSSTTGKEFRLGEGYKPTTRLDIIQRFLESKESPVASFVTSLLKGQTSMGEEVKVAPEIVDRFIPMMAQDLYDLNKEYGSKGTLMALPGMFGVGSQTYTDQIPMSAKTPTGKATVKWRQQPSLGERLINKVTGEQISDIPKEQWKPLYEAKQAENIKKIDVSSAKARVLETGNPETIDNTLIYLDNGIVKTKDLTPKEAKPQKISTKKVLTKKISTKKPKQIKLKSIKVPKVKQIKVKQIKIPKAKVIKLGKIKKPRTIKLKTISYKK